MGFGDKYAGMGTFDEAMATKATLEPGHLRCWSCSTPFDVNDVTINGRPVCGGVYCSTCEQAGYDGGRWQSMFKYEVAA